MSVLARVLEGNKWGGNYLSEWIDARLDQVINGVLVSEWVLVNKIPDTNLTIKEWNGTDWVEGISNEELIAIRKKEYTSRLQELVAYLRIRSKACVMEKEGSSKYIFSQVEFYELKYNVAKGNIINQVILDLIENEAVEYGLSLNDFKALIINKFEYAKNEYEVFLFMVERCRTKIQTLIENGDWVNIDQAFLLIASLDDQNQASSIMSQVLALGQV